MVKEAEKYKAEDDKVRAKIEARNSLESTTYGYRNTMDEEKVKEALSDEDKEKVNKIVTDTIAWLDEHQDEEKEVSFNSCNLLTQASLFAPSLFRSTRRSSRRWRLQSFPSSSLSTSRLAPPAECPAECPTWVVRGRWFLDILHFVFPTYHSRNAWWNAWRYAGWNAWRIRRRHACWGGRKGPHHRGGRLNVFP